MKAHRLIITIIDTDDLGAEEVSAVIENNRYPNHCIAPQVQQIDTFDVGPWNDEHPLNQRKTHVLNYLNMQTPIGTWEPE